MEQQVGALVVRDAAVRVVRVFALLELDDQALVPRPVRVQREVVEQRLGADDEVEPALRGRVELPEQQALDVGRPALVEPEVVLVRVSETRQGPWGQSDDHFGQSTYVTPFPNQEWVSSCTATSTLQTPGIAEKNKGKEEGTYLTRERSPTKSARSKMYQYTGYRDIVWNAYSESGMSNTRSPVIIVNEYSDP